VNETLIGLCGKLGSFKKQCEEYVSTYFDLAYEFLIQSLDPKWICVEMDICPNLETDLSGVSVPAIKLPLREPLLNNSETLNDIENDSDSCQDCKTFTVDVIAILQKMGKGALKDKLMSLCKSQMSSFLCKRVISNANANMIYNYLTTQMTPDSFCNFAAMCSNNGFQMVNNVNGIPCILCQMIAKNVRHFLDSNSTRTEIHDKLQWLCSKLSPIKDKCLSFLKNDFDIVYNYIIIALDPGIVCFLTGFCVEGSYCNSADTGTAFSEKVEVVFEELFISDANL